MVRDIRPYVRRRRFDSLRYELFDTQVSFGSRLGIAWEPPAARIRASAVHGGLKVTRDNNEDAVRLRDA